MTAPDWTVVATEDDPARAEWTRAAQDAGVPAPRFVPWSAVLDSEAEFRPGEVVFAERLYPCFTENPVRGQRARYEELQTALSRLDAVLAEAGARSATPAEPASLALDRTKCAAFLRENGIRVPDACEPSVAVRNFLRPRYAGSDEWSIDAWRTRLFRHRSRIAGFEVWRAAGRGSTDKQELAEIVALLADDGIHAVEWLRRVHMEGASYDFRFAVMDGEVTHGAGVMWEETVLREWYGGRRPEIGHFLDRFGMERWERLVALAERTAACFPGIRSLGVDLTVDNDASEYVADVNPFGAHLPGLVLAPPNVEREHMTVRAAVLRALSADS